MTARPGRPERPRRPLHPPLTDFPIAAYVFAAAFDVISAIGGDRHSWARQFWHAGTFVLITGACICVLTVLTGFRDLLRFPHPRAPAIRSLLIHICVMVSVFMIGVGDIAWRLRDYSASASTPAGILVLSLVAATGVCVGAGYGGALVFRHGAGVAKVDAWPEPEQQPAGLMPSGPTGCAEPAGAAGLRHPAAGNETMQAARHRLRRGK
jgi:uncharacterized membrane protein